MGLETLLVIAMFAAFMVLLLLGFPVAWSLAGIGLVFAVLANFLIEHFDADLWFTWNGTIGVLDARLYGVVANELMVALPLFIFMGIMLDRSGIAEKLMHSLVRVLGSKNKAARISPRQTCDQPFKSSRNASACSNSSRISAHDRSSIEIRSRFTGTGIHLFLGV